MPMIRTSDAARSLGLHPLGLIARLQGMVGCWTECWPQVDAGYVETLKVMLNGPEVSRARAQMAVPQGDVAGECPHGVGATAARLIEKLWRKSFWGDTGVALDTIHVHMLHGVDDYDAILDDLIRRGFLLGKGRRGPFSLNPRRKAEIDAIAAWSTEHPGAD